MKLTPFFNWLIKPNWAIGITGMTASKKGLKDRIKMISKFKKKPLYWTVAAVVTFTVLAVIGLTNSQAKETKVVAKNSKYQIKKSTSSKENKKEAVKQEAIPEVNQNATPVTENNLQFINKVGNTNGNLLNLGTAAVQGDWGYYVSYSLNDPDKGIKSVLYKVNQGTKEKTKLYESNGKINYINVIGQWIYYLDNNKIFKIKVNGSEIQKLSEDEAAQLIVSGDWLYYSTTKIGYSTSGVDKYKIIKIKNDGTSKTLFTESTEPYTLLGLDGKWLYARQQIQTDKKLYKFNTDETGKSQVLNLDANDNVFMENGLIFYTNIATNKGIYKMNQDGINVTKINDDAELLLNIADNWIYYGNGTGIYKIKEDGTGKAKVAKTSDNKGFYRYNINLLSGWICYDINGPEGSNQPFHNSYFLKTDGSGFTQER